MHHAAKMSWLALTVGAGAAAVSAGVAYQQLESIRSRRRFAAPGRFADAGGGRRLHYQCAGHGAPLVVLEAGIAASSLSWGLVQPEIASFARVCSYDRAGLAWSDPGERVRSIDRFVADLRSVLHRTGAPPPYVLVGHSFGGLVIRAFARTHPDETAGLIFVDTLHPEEWCDPSTEQRRMLQGGVLLSEVGVCLARVGVVRACLSLLSGGAPGVPRRVSRLFGPTAAALLDRIVGEVQKLPASLLPTVQSHWSQPKAFRGMAQHLAALPFCSSRMPGSDAVLRRIPIVVLSAANRSERWLAADAALAQLSSSGRHLISSRAGHWILLDDPSLVIDAVRDVVDRARSERDMHRFSYGGYA